LSIRVDNELILLAAAARVFEPIKAAGITAISVPCLY